MNISTPQYKGFNLPGLRSRGLDRESGPRRLPGFSWLGDTPRHHLVALIGEFVGTFLFLFFAFTATQVANMSALATNATGPEPAVLLYISLAFGFSLAVNVWVFFRISGGLFNPAVTLGLCLVGAVGWIRGLIVFIAQILGGIAASGVVYGLFPGPLLVRTDLSSSPKTSHVQGVFIEMFLTAQLIFTIFMLAAEKHKGTFLAPIGIGLALFIAELAGVYWTSGSLNPARSFGPEVVSGNFKGDHWVYWVGPGLGALLAVLFYRLVKILEYETANPGADNSRRPSAVPRGGLGHDRVLSGGPLGENRDLPHHSRGLDGTTEDPSLDSNETTSSFNADTSAFPAPPPSMDKSPKTYLSFSGNPFTGFNVKADGKVFSHGSDAEKGQMPKNRKL